MTTYDNLDGRLSPYLRRARMEISLPYIHGDVLDFGCGIGLLCDNVENKSGYVGVDIDADIIEVAKKRNPSATFLTLDQMETIADRKFHCIAGMAVIEHLPNPSHFLEDVKKRLSRDGRIVLTTPNPALDWAHGLGSKLGIFARESHEEHQSLMGRRALHRLATDAGLDMEVYRRFLLGANQLAVLRHKE